MGTRWCIYVVAGGTKHTRENENDMEEGIGRQRTEATSNRSSPTVYCSMAYFRFPGLVSLS